MYTIENLFYEWKWDLAGGLKIQRRAQGQRAFLLHSCSLVSSFWRPFESTATVANMSVSLGTRSLVLYFLIASKDIQSVVTNYYHTVSRR